MAALTATEVRVILSARDALSPVLAKVRGGLRDAGAVIESTGTKLRELGRRAALFSGVVSAVGGAAIFMAADFGKAMANVQTLIPGAEERVLSLSRSVQDLAMETGVSTADLADGLYQVVSAFGDTADTAQILEINAKAAAAGLATTTDALNLTSAVTKGYGDVSAKTVQSVADLAFTAVRLGQTTFPELASSMGRVVPLAAALTVSQEELFGVMATATGVTGSAAEVSTQLRGVLQSLSAPTQVLTGLIGDMGFSSGKAMVESLGLQGTIEAIVAAAESTNQPLQSYIGQIEGQTLALALAGPQADVFTAKLHEMTLAEGAAAIALDAMNTGVGEAKHVWNQLVQSAKVLGQQIGDILIPHFIRFVKIGRDLIQWVISWPTAFKKVIVVLGLLVAGFAPLVGALGLFIKLAWGSVKAFAAMNTIMGLTTAKSLLLAGGTKQAAAGMSAVGSAGLLSTGRIASMGRITGTLAKILAGVGHVAAAGAVRMTALGNSVKGVKFIFFGLARVLGTVAASILGVSATAGTIAASSKWFIRLGGAVNFLLSPLRAGILLMRRSVSALLAINPVVALVVAGIYLLLNSFDEGKRLFSAVGNLIRTVVVTAFQLLSSVISAIAGVITGNFTRGVDGAGRSLKSLVPQNLLDLLTSLAAGIERVTASINDMSPAARHAAVGLLLIAAPLPMLRRLITRLLGVGKAIKAAGGIVKLVGGWFATFGGAILKVGGFLAKLIPTAATIGKLFTALKVAVAALLSPWVLVIGAATAFFTLTASGREIISGLWRVIKLGLAAGLIWLREKFDDVKGAVAGTGDKFSWLSGIVDSVKHAVKQFTLRLKEMIPDWVVTGIRKLKDALRDLGDTFQTYIDDNAWKSGIGGVVTEIGELRSEVTNAQADVTASAEELRALGVVLDDTAYAAALAAGLDGIGGLPDPLDDSQEAARKLAEEAAAAAEALEELRIKNAIMSAGLEGSRNRLQDMEFGLAGVRREMGLLLADMPTAVLTPTLDSSGLSAGLMNPFVGLGAGAERAARVVKTHAREMANDVAGIGEAGDEAGKTLASSMASAFERAFEGGGGFFGGMSSIIIEQLTGPKGPLTRMASGLQGMFGSSGIGGAFSGALSGILTGGIGTAVNLGMKLLGKGLGKIGGMLKRAFGGPSEMELAGREAAGSWLEGMRVESVYVAASGGSRRRVGRRRHGQVVDRNARCRSRSRHVDSGSRGLLEPHEGGDRSGSRSR